MPLYFSIHKESARWSVPRRIKRIHGHPIKFSVILLSVPTRISIHLGLIEIFNKYVELFNNKICMPFLVTDH